MIPANAEMLAELFSGDPAQVQVAAQALRATTGSAAAPAPAGDDTGERLAKLDALQERGLLTHEEHAEQRRRILDAI